MKKIRVCKSRACSAFGAEKLMAKLSQETNLSPGEKNNDYDIDYCGCLGYCSRSPNILINDDHIIFSAREETVMKDIDNGGESLKGEEISLDSLDDEDNFLKNK